MSYIKSLKRKVQRSEQDLVKLKANQDTAELIKQKIAA